MVNRRESPRGFQWTYTARCLEAMLDVPPLYLIRSILPGSLRSKTEANELIALHQTDVWVRRGWHVIDRDETCVSTCC